MLNKIVNATKEEAREQALNLLLGTLSKGETYKTTESTRYSVTYGEDATLLDEAKGNYEREEELYSLITNEETGAKVLYFHVPTTTEDYYRIAYFAPEEWKRYTLPFKHLQESTLFVAVALNACFVKPVKELSPAEALTPEFANELNAHFHTDEWTYTKEEYISKGFTLENSFRVEDEEVEANPKECEEEYNNNIIFVAYASPSILTELTGVKIKSVQDYMKALKKYLNASTLDERQERAVTSSLEFDLRDLFLKWATYEFMRTEDYSHLKECLKEYKRFLLPKEWAKGLCYLNVEPEEYVITKYISKDALNLLGTNELREIATGTGTPLPLILKASKRSIWDF